MEKKSLKIGSQVLIQGNDSPVTIDALSIVNDGENYDYSGNCLLNGRRTKVYFNDSDIIFNNNTRVLMGTIIGDIVGSVYEFKTIKTKQFKFLKPKCMYTDDTVMTCAVSLACLDYKKNNNIEEFKKNLIEYMKRLGRKFPDARYGYRFYEWITGDEDSPYNSYGNGGAMRTSSVAYIADSLDEALELAKAQSEVTHDHPEAIKGSQAISACIYLALNGYDKREIKDYIEKYFYPLGFTIKDVYRKYKYDISATGSVPFAIVAFLDGYDFEDCVRNAICLGGDADTLAAMTGAIAEAYYGVPENIVVDRYLDQELLDIVNNFNDYLRKNNKNVFEKIEKNKQAHCNDEILESRNEQQVKMR